LPGKRRSRAIVEGLKGTAADCRLQVPADGQSLPILELVVDERRLGRSAIEVCRGLRQGQPPIQVGHGGLFEGKLVVNPMHLNQERTAALLKRLREELTPR
jgi:L-seryl-tRNA(Ser) seleniumtransferase